MAGGVAKLFGRNWSGVLVGVGGDVGLICTEYQLGLLGCIIISLALNDESRETFQRSLVTHQ